MNFSGKDTLAKAISSNKESVIYVINATDLVQESMERIDLWPPATVHLGQAMMGAALLQALSEGKVAETVSFQWKSNGPFGNLYAEARNYGEIRGTIENPRPDVHDYETNLGEGTLQVRRATTTSTTGVVPSVGNVSLDVVEYLERSEQRTCGINLSVKIDWDENTPDKFHVHHALGYLIHVLPQPTEQAEEEALLRWDRHMRALGPISGWTLREDQIEQDMIRLITLEEEPNITMNQRIKFSCQCNENRALRAVALMHAQEGSEPKEEKETLEVRCEYCGEVYEIDPKKTNAP